MNQVIILDQSISLRYVYLCSLCRILNKKSQYFTQYLTKIISIKKLSNMLTPVKEIHTLRILTHTFRKILSVKTVNS